MTKYDSSFDHILQIEYEDIMDVQRTIDRKTVETVIDRLLRVRPEGRKVITAGCGTSGMLARRVAHTLNVAEIPSFFCNPADAVHGGAGAIQKDDVVVLFSKGGNTGEILNFIPICRAKGACMIGVSQNDDSVLARESDIYFRIEVKNEADPWNMCASASCNTIAAVWDAVAFTAMRCSGYTKDDLQLIHPGGRVGELLLAGQKEAGEDLPR